MACFTTQTRWRLSYQADPANVKRDNASVENGVEYIGVFSAFDKLETHLKAEGRRIIISVPFADVSIKDVYYETHGILLRSNDSCTTNLVFTS